MIGKRPDGATRVGIAQTLALAEAANVKVSAQDGKLVLEAPEKMHGVAQAIETYLAEFGRENAVAFLTSTSEEERRLLSAIPPVKSRRVFHTRLVPL
jgi:hypothetical protein